MPRISIRLFTSRPQKNNDFFVSPHFHFHTHFFPGRKRNFALGLPRDRNSYPWGREAETVPMIQRYGWHNWLIGLLWASAGNVLEVFRNGNSFRTWALRRKFPKTWRASIESILRFVFTVYLEHHKKVIIRNNWTRWAWRRREQRRRKDWWLKKTQAAYLSHSASYSTADSVHR